MKSLVEVDFWKLHDCTGSYALYVTESAHALCRLHCQVNSTPEIFSKVFCSDQESNLGLLLSRAGALPLSYRWLLRILHLEVLFLSWLGKVWCAIAKYRIAAVSLVDRNSNCGGSFLMKSLVEVDFLEASWLHWKLCPLCNWIGSCPLQIHRWLNRNSEMTQNFYAPTGDWTRDLQFDTLMLFQLSYWGLYWS